MFKVEMKGKDAIVTRTLDLPATGILKPYSVSASFKVDCDLGIAPREPAAREIYGDFLARYRKELEARGKARMSDYLKLWKDAERDLGANMHDRKEFLSISEMLYSAIDAKWQSFNHDDAIKAAQDCLDAAATAAIKGGKAARGEVKPKVKLGDKGNAPDRKSFLTSLLKLVAGGAAAGPVGVALASLDAVPKAVLSVQRILWRSAKDVGTNAAEIEAALARADKAVKELNPSVKLLAASRKVMTLQMVEMTRELKSAEAEIARGAASIKDQKKEAAALAAAARQVSSIRADIGKLGDDTAQLKALIQAIAAAQAAVDKAHGLAKTETKGWDGLMRRFEKINDDTNNVMSTISSLIKGLG